MRFYGNGLTFLALLQASAGNEDCIFAKPSDIAATSLAQVSKTKRKVTLDPEAFLTKDALPQITQHPSFHSLFLQILCLVALLALLFVVSRCLPTDATKAPREIHSQQSKAANFDHREAAATREIDRAKTSEHDARVMDMDSNAFKIPLPSGRFQADWTEQALQSNTPAFLPSSGLPQTRPSASTEPDVPVLVPRLDFPQSRPIATGFQTDRTEHSLQSNRPAFVPPLDLLQSRRATAASAEQHQYMPELDQYQGMPGTQSSLDSETPLGTLESMQGLVPVPSERAQNIRQSTEETREFANPQAGGSQAYIPRTRSLSPRLSSKTDLTKGSPIVGREDEEPTGDYTPNFGPLPPLAIPVRPLKSRPYLLRPPAPAAKSSQQAQFFNLATPRPRGAVRS